MVEGQRGAARAAMNRVRVRGNPARPNSITSSSTGNQSLQLRARTEPTIEGQSWSPPFKASAASRSYFKKPAGDLLPSETSPSREEQRFERFNNTSVPSRTTSARAAEAITPTRQKPLRNKQQRHPQSGSNHATALQEQAAGAILPSEKEVSPTYGQKENRPSMDPSSQQRKFINNHITPPRSLATTGLPIERVDDDSSPGFVDEEPLILPNENIDALTLTSGSLVTVSNHCAYNDAVSVTDSEGSCNLFARMSELIRKAEAVLRIDKVSEKNRGSTSKGTVIRYGDTVTFTSTNNRALGVKRSRSADMYTLGFFQAKRDTSDRWKVLWSGKTCPRPTTRTVLVGSHAVSLRQKNDKQPKGAVRSDGSVVLRNIRCGGLLSFHKDHGLTLLTDSFESEDFAFSNSRASLLGRLERHNKLQPTLSEHFQITHVSVPPCPEWVAKASEKRPFLFTPCPNLGNIDTLQGESFHADTLKRGFVYRKTAFDSRQKQRSMQQQEALLVGDVIGSLMGLESLHIKAKAKDGRRLQNETANESEFEFLFVDNDLSVDTSLSKVVCLIIPLATNLMRVRTFIASRLPGYQYGSCQNALCQAIEELLQECLGYVASLRKSYFDWCDSPDDSSFTMKALYSALTPAIDSMEILHEVTAVVGCLKGGALLNSLRNLMTIQYAGNMNGQCVLGFLLDKAAVPYMNMLSGWLENGILQDPFSEFMIEPKRVNDLLDWRASSFVWLNHGDEWDDLFRIREHHVCDLLSTENTKEKILLTGKCWNAVRYCLKMNRSNDDNVLVAEDSSLNPMEYAETVVTLHSSVDMVLSYVDNLYESASKTLLDVIFKDFSLLETLRTMKRFFLFDQGDFFVDFVDSAEAELAKDVGKVSRGRIQNWLRRSIQRTERDFESMQSVAIQTGLRKHLDGFPLTANDLRCSFTGKTLEEQLEESRERRNPEAPPRSLYEVTENGLTGMVTFTLDFNSVAFPTSLIISSGALSSYKLLFQLLFRLKNVERQLVGLWLDYQTLKELRSLRGALGSTYCLRQKMLNFAQNIIYYMMFEVIETNWIDLHRKIRDGRTDNAYGTAKRCQTVDDIRAAHDDFLRETLHNCLLTNSDTISALAKVLDTCLTFAQQMNRFMAKTRILDRKHLIATDKRSRRSRFVAKRSRSCLRKVMMQARLERRGQIQTDAATVIRELNNESYERLVTFFDNAFEKNMRDFVVRLASNPDDRFRTHRTNLLVRLDCDKYVARSLAL